MTVSVVIPTYNAAAYVDRAIDSVLLQGKAVTEIILVDNNSTDGTLAILTGYVRADPGLFKLHRAIRQGAAAARNVGWRAAKGAWVQFLDADDVLLAGKVDRQLSLVTTATDWVIGGHLYVDREGRESPRKPATDPWKGLVYNGGIGNTNANLFRRSALLLLEGQNEELHSAEDLDLYFRLLVAERAYVIDPVPGSAYRQRSGDRLSELPIGKLHVARMVLGVIDHLSGKRPQYYRANERFYASAFLRALRRLATHNLPEATRLYQQEFLPRFPSKAIDETMVGKMPLFYPFFGFRGTEYVRTAVGAMLRRWRVAPQSARRRLSRAK